MKAHVVLFSIFRLFLIATIGVGLGLTAWRLISDIGWNGDTVWIPNLVGPVFPILTLAWVGSMIVYGTLLVRPSTRSLGLNGLITTLTFWLVTTLIVVGVYYSFGTAYSPPFIDVVGRAAYFAAGLSFGFILTPLLIIRVLLLSKNK